MNAATSTPAPAVLSTPRPFRASVVRELRQHGLWAGAVAVALSAVLAFLLFISRDSGQSMAGEPFKSGTLMLFAGLGLTFGLAVMLLERRRGHWGFLVSRPLSRRRLFATKFVAAAGMYLVATTLAITAATVFAHSPRYVRAPFTPAMLLPAVYFQCCGLAWLACGLLIAVRDASWVGTRLYPLAITALTLALVYAGGYSFVVSVVLVLLLTAGLAVSGAHFFAANGAYEPQPRWAKPLAFLVVFSGALVLLTGGVDQMAGAVHDIVAADAPRQVIDTYYTFYGFGQPGQYIRFNNGTTQDLTLSGRPTDPAFDPLGPNRGFGGSVDLIPSNPYDTDRARARAAQKTFLTQDAFHRNGIFDRHGLVTYDFMPGRRTVEIYDYDDKYLGGVGPNGFYDATTPQDPFPVTSRLRGGGGASRALVLSNDTVWRIDLPRRTVEVVYRTDADGPVLDAAECWAGSSARFVCVLTPRHVYAVPVSHEAPLPDDAGTSASRWQRQPPPLVPTPGPVRSLELPEAKPLGRVSVAVFGDDGLAALTDPTPGEDMHPMVTRTLNGTLTHRALPPLPTPVKEPALTDRGPVALTLPPVLVPLTKWSRTASPLAWLLPVAPLVAVGLTLLMARRRRFDRRTTGLWVGLSVLLGLHAPLTLLGLRQEPMLVRCPACGKWRPADRDHCPRCAAAWPTPGDPATGVFEPTPVAA